jgi:hypothetical protein
MYQLEVKSFLIAERFSPKDGWEVVVDIDAMERARGGQQRADKKERVEKAEQALRRLGVRIVTHPQYGRVDIVASHREHGIYLIEVEGESTKQKEQAVYSALGQSLLLMGDTPTGITYGVALPDLPEWERQMLKIPPRVKDLLNLRCFLVSQKRVREI